MAIRVGYEPVREIMQTARGVGQGERQLAERQRQDQLSAQQAQEGLAYDRLEQAERFHRDQQLLKMTQLNDQRERHMLQMTQREVEQELQRDFQREMMERGHQLQAETRMGQTRLQLAMQPLFEAPAGSALDEKGMAKFANYNQKYQQLLANNEIDDVTLAMGVTQLRQEAYRTLAPHLRPAQSPEEMIASRKVDIEGFTVFLDEMGNPDAAMTKLYAENSPEAQGRREAERDAKLLQDAKKEYYTRMQALHKEEDKRARDLANEHVEAMKGELPGEMDTPMREHVKQTAWQKKYDDVYNAGMARRGQWIESQTERQFGLPPGAFARMQSDAPGEPEQAGAEPPPSLEDPAEADTPLPPELGDPVSEEPPAPDDETVAEEAIRTRFPTFLEMAADIPGLVGRGLGEAQRREELARQWEQERADRRAWLETPEGQAAMAETRARIEREVREAEDELWGEIPEFWQPSQADVDRVAAWNRSRPEEIRLALLEEHDREAFRELMRHAGEVAATYPAPRQGRRPVSVRRIASQILARQRAEQARREEQQTAGMDAFVADMPDIEFLLRPEVSEGRIFALGQSYEAAVISHMRRMDTASYETLMREAKRAMEEDERAEAFGVDSTDIEDYAREIVRRKLLHIKATGTVAKRPEERTADEFMRMVEEGR